MAAAQDCAPHVNRSATHFSEPPQVSFVDQGRENPNPSFALKNSAHALTGVSETPSIEPFLKLTPAHSLLTGQRDKSSPKKTPVFKSGDWVEVRPMAEILATLDENGALDGLAFMPEMAGYCRQYFSVARRAEQICTDSAPVAPGESRVREFHHNDVVTLEGLRCSGCAHGGCQRGCLLFWKEAWLVAAPRPLPLNDPPAATVEPLSQSLCTDTGEGRHLCQSGALLHATRPLSGRQRWRKCFTNVRVGNYRWFEMIGMLLTWLGHRAHYAIFGVHPRGAQNPTPDEALQLRPGELVEVKSLREIIGTLDRHGKNRGLHFSPDMIAHCGRRYRVRTRAKTLIGEGTGLRRNLKNTVILEDATCNSATFAFGGCPRDHFLYWREIWLNRIVEDNTSTLVTDNMRSSVRTTVD